MKLKLSSYLDLSSDVSSFLPSEFSFVFDSVLSDSPSVVVSSVLVSASTVGGTKVATTKSLSVIVGFTPSGRLILLILIASPISVFSKSKCSFSGILLALQLSSTNLRTKFKTPPFFNPGQDSLFKNSTSISTVTLVSSYTRRKSKWINLSVTGSY